MSIEFVESSVKSIVSTLNSIRFDAFSSQFVLNKKRYRDDYASDDITLKYDKCPVCFELTCRKTVCNHFLCLPCDRKVKFGVCPVCRGNLATEDDLEDDFEDDSEDDSEEDV